MEGWLFPGIGEKFTQLEAAKSSAWTAILSVTVQGFQFNHRETLVDSITPVLQTPSYPTVLAAMPEQSTLENCITHSESAPLTVL